MANVVEVLQRPRITVTQRDLIMRLLKSFPVDARARFCGMYLSLSTASTEQQANIEYELSLMIKPD